MYFIQSIFQIFFPVIFSTSPLLLFFRYFFFLLLSFLQSLKMTLYMLAFDKILQIFIILSQTHDGLAQDCNKCIADALVFSLALNHQHVCHARPSTISSLHYANPVYGVATICHQVPWLRWGHLSLFHTATSLLIPTFGIRARVVLSCVGGRNAGGYGCNSRVLCRPLCIVLHICTLILINFYQWHQALW